MRPGPFRVSRVPQWPLLTWGVGHGSAPGIGQEAETLAPGHVPGVVTSASKLALRAPPPGTVTWAPQAVTEAPWTFTKSLTARKGEQSNARKRAAPSPQGQLLLSKRKRVLENALKIMLRHPETAPCWLPRSSGWPPPSVLPCARRVPSSPSRRHPPIVPLAPGSKPHSVSGVEVQVPQRGQKHPRVGPSCPTQDEKSPR